MTGNSSAGNGGVSLRPHLLLLFACSAFGPLMVWANAGEDPVVVTLLLAVVVIFAIGLLALVVARRIGFEIAGASYAIGVFLLVFTNAGIFIERVPMGRLLFIALGLVVGILAYRRSDKTYVRIVFSWLTIVLLAYPFVASFGGSRDDGSYLLPSEELGVESFDEKPDVVMVLLDGYASPVVLDELYGYDSSSFRASLQEFGFEVPEFTVANYGMTQLSVPTLLDLGYVAGETPISSSDLEQLLAKLGGSNQLASALSDEGYRQVYLESGWLGTRCTDDVDVCISAPWPDETMSDVVYRTLLRGLPGFEVGRSFTRGALHVLDWLENDIQEYLSNGTPDFIYAHLLLPHPPLFIASDCSTAFSSGYPGFEVGDPSMSEDELAGARRAYVDQVKCVESVLASLAEEVGPEVALVAIGDHGPDSLNQLFYTGDPWTEEQRKERLSVFFAARVPECDMASIDSVVNAGRRLLSCLSGGSIQDLATSSFEWQTVDGNRKLVEVEAPTQ